MTDQSGRGTPAGTAGISGRYRWRSVDRAPVCALGGITSPRVPSARAERGRPSPPYAGEGHVEGLPENDRCAAAEQCLTELHGRPTAVAVLDQLVGPEQRPVRPADPGLAV